MSEARADDPDRPPVPAIVAAALVVCFVHFPLWSAPALLDEIPFQQGWTRPSGWTPGMQWLHLEALLTGSRFPLHRAIGAALELLWLGLGLLLLKRWRMLRSLAVLGLAAMLVHPLHTETSLRLSHRGVLVSEILLLLAAVIASRGLLRSCLSLLLAAAATFGFPGLAIPGMCCVFLRQGFLGFGLGSVAGAVLGFFHSQPGTLLPSGTRTLQGLETLTWPWDVGLVLPEPRLPWLSFAMLVVWWVMVTLPGREISTTATRRVRVRRCAVPALAVIGALILGPMLRPDRTDRAEMGTATTPEMFIPALITLTVPSLRGGAVRRSTASLLLIALSGACGFTHARRFSSEERCLSHSVTLAPLNVELRVLQGEAFLRVLGQVPADQRRAWAEQAYHCAEVAIRVGRGSPAARALSVLALGYLGKTAEARQESDRLLEEAKVPLLALMVRSHVELIDGELLGSLRYLRSALQREDGERARLSYRAVLEILQQEIEALLAQKHTADARRLGEEILVIAPEEWFAKEATAISLVLEERFSEAIGEYQRLLEDARGLLPERQEALGLVRKSLAALINLNLKVGDDSQAARMERALRDFELEQSSWPRKKG